MPRLPTLKASIPAAAAAIPPTTAAIPAAAAIPTTVASTSAAAPSTSAVIPTTSAIPTTSTIPPAAAAASAPSSSAAGAALDGALVGAGDVGGLGAAVAAGFDDELDGLAVAQAAEAVGADRGLVDEEVIAAVVRGDEAEPLLVVEPLHDPRHPGAVTFSH
ncbi:hypothetical protein RHMOL_Rhmol05G0071500 [Rhododendron molle]|uniref:Uncharacterized protein n=1 Tax=Rhododendron molle TaxID=49168 RepID=A0ACC0NNC2_RHOML|nr:hypothetical protein RHMOL_Rhmol05G0071500 [Rhododendron molle]